MEFGIQPSDFGFRPSDFQLIPTHLFTSANNRAKPLSHSTIAKIFPGE